MKTNMGKTDKTLRLILGVLVAFLGIYFQSWWGLIALPLIGTSLIGTCPAYLPFGISTCKTDKT
jgi:hypothetical protein